MEITGGSDGLRRPWRDLFFTSDGDDAFSSSDALGIRRVAPHFWHTAFTPRDLKRSSGIRYAVRHWGQTNFMSDLYAYILPFSDPGCKSFGGLPAARVFPIKPLSCVRP
jgi:hypothetical protein